MGIIVSFCITVYNQSQLVKKCIDSIVAYPGKDIEIIISDDGSTEDICGLVSLYHDDRIKYYLNEKNLGHDRNILNALSKATGQYAFLLRTRDLMIPDKIPLLIEAAKTGDASYITGEAVNENGELKIHYSKEFFTQGQETIDANFKLFIHPSGNMYRLSDLDFQKIWSFLDENDVPKNGFIVHSLIRLKLANTGNFRLIKEPVWIYTDTEVAVDRAVNKSNNGLNVYDPTLTGKRYEYEVKWATEILRAEDYRAVYYLLTALYLDTITWGFKLSNSDKQSQYHYNYQQIKFSVSKERKQFRKICEKLYNEKRFDDPDLYKKKMNHIFLTNKTNGAVKYIVRFLTYKTPLYHMASRVYKKYMKGL